MSVEHPVVNETARNACHFGSILYFDYVAVIGTSEYGPGLAAEPDSTDRNVGEPPSTSLDEPRTLFVGGVIICSLVLCGK